MMSLSFSAAIKWAQGFIAGCVFFCEEDHCFTRFRFSGTWKVSLGAEDRGVSHSTTAYYI